jgi:tetratricopeptide (TPR) repeat protein
MAASGAAVTLAPVAAIAAKKDEASPLKPSADVIPKYQEGAKAVQAKDFATAKAKAQEILAAAKTPDDKFLAGQLLIQAGQGAQDEATLRQGIELALDSGKTPPDQAAKFNLAAGQIALKAKDYDGAITRLNAAAAANPSDSSAELLLAEAHFSKATTQVANNQLTPAGKALAVQGLGHLRRAIDAEKAAGRAPEGSWYSRGFRMAVLAGSPDLPQWTGEALKSDPGNSGNWRLALRGFQDSNRTMTRDENLDVLRLMAASGALKEPYDYQEYIEAAMKGGLYGEAKSVIDSGRAAGHISPSLFNDQYQIATAGIPKDKASLPAAAADAAKAPTGKTAASTASAFFGYGDYAKAVELYRLALQKGGVDADEVNTRIGIALARSGDFTGAKTAFASVTKPGNRKTIADFWTLWLSTKQA